MLLGKIVALLGLSVLLAWPAVALEAAEEAEGLMLSEDSEGEVSAV